ncbi:AraC family transcriptional regulator [Olivibacter sp. XZL3]|uniref:helix-turn-helix domain-containing protein n=1 Tax=Olivibacter sp. XZL3 TaxID=1735116 RepID=UPI00106629C1|nr:helix-turn-helix domain-containing protein [Olivibacter sp. XZL3]
MEKAINVGTIPAFHIFNKTETRHSLVSLVKQSQRTLESDLKLHPDLYCIALTYHENQQGKLSIIFPGHGGEQKIEPDKQKKHALVFHPDLIQGTPLANNINEWKFLGYSADTYLHLSPQECQLISDCFGSIEVELEYAMDKHSKKLIISHIERLLNYCMRFYDRQIVFHEDSSKGILKRFDLLLNDYLSSGNIYEIGIPMVAYFADKLHHSPNYFGDLIKKETGMSAQEYIRNRIAREAKNRIGDRDKSINKIAFELGFKYPQHFSRFFKKMVGLSPNEFRATIAK